MSGLLLAELGILSYEQNDLEASQNYIQEAITVAKPWGFLEAFLPAYSGLVRLRRAQGDLAGASAALDELSELGKGNRAMVMPAVELLRAGLWISTGNGDAVGRWATDQGLSPDAALTPIRFEHYLVLTRLLILQGGLDQAAGLLSRLLEMAQEGGWMGKVIELLLLQSLAFQAMDRPDMTITLLERALVLAEPEGYVRIFVDEGLPMATLLGRLASTGDGQDYAARLLGQFDQDETGGRSLPASSSVEPVGEHELVESLSERELEVLKLMKSELSGPEIAAELMIALSTFRFHTKNIYGKLGVSSRRAAVYKAVELNLV
jgi:LuxR family maltose regulon positive regulatory protein